MLTKLFLSSFSIAKREFMTITPSATERIQTLLSKKSDPEIIGVKIGLTKKGCNGLTYEMKYVKDHAKFDETIRCGKYKVIIDSKALMVLVGTQMDFVENELGSEFVFNNPNEKGKCGCGESFHI